MRRPHAPTRLLLSATAAATVAAGLGVSLAGCGHTVAVGASRTVQVSLSEYRVNPQSIRSRAGELTLVVENDGRLSHDLAVSSHGQIVAQTAPLPPGTSTALVLSLSPGSYLMTSTLFSDEALGTYGTLTVTR